MLTLQQKFEALHAAEDAVGKALADLADTSTGEAIAPGKEVFAAVSRKLYRNVDGRIVASKPQIVALPKGTA